MRFQVFVHGKIIPNCWDSWNIHATPFSRLWKKILLWWNTLCLSVIDPFMCLLSDDVFNILMVCISPFWCFVAKCIPLSFAEKAMLPTVILLPPSNNECTVTYAMQHTICLSFHCHIMTLSTLFYIHIFCMHAHTGIFLQYWSG